MKALLTALLLLLLIPLSALADGNKTAPFSGFIKFVKYHAAYDVNPDGTHTETCEIAIEVMTEEGVRYANQANISYSDSLQTIEITSAYTLKKDGRIIPVPPANISDRAAVAGGGPMFSDIKTKAIIFPDVAIGDRVVYSYRNVHKTALFPGQFSMTEVFTRTMVYDDARISVTVPAGSLDLRVFSDGVEGGAIDDKDGRKRWVWTYRNQDVAEPEFKSIAEMDYGPRIIVSSFKDYGAIATAYEERARPKAAVTEKIRALAEDITRGVSGQREQAMALYNWVSRNINYAGNCIGIGSVVPHDAETVLANRLGDCKDHTALLQALLQARGIKSTPALVNLGASFKLPEVPSVGVFNHVINYIPSLDLYADSTAQYIPFGMLPIGESDKPVIHTADFSGIRHTPPTDYRKNRSRTKTVLRMHDDGSADGEADNEEGGVFMAGVRAVMANLPPNMEETVMKGILSRGGYTGTGTMIKSDPREPADSYAYGGRFHINNAMNLPGPGAIRLVPIFYNAVPIAMAPAELSAPESKHDYPCYGGISDEEITIELPESAKVVALPKDVRLESKHLSYSSAYRQKGRNITVIRRFEDRTATNLCTPEDDREFRNAARTILKDIQSQLIYE